MKTYSNHRVAARSCLGLVLALAVWTPIYAQPADGMDGRMTRVGKMMTDGRIEMMDAKMKMIEGRMMMLEGRGMMDGKPMMKDMKDMDKKPESDEKPEDAHKEHHE